MFQKAFCLFLVFAGALAFGKEKALVGGTPLVPPPAFQNSAELRAFYNKINSVKIDLSQSYHTGVKDAEFSWDSFAGKSTFHAHLDEGVLLFSKKIAERLYVGVYIGKGSFFLDVPDSAARDGWRRGLFHETSHRVPSGVFEAHFKDAFFVVDEALRKRILGLNGLNPGEEARVLTPRPLAKKFIERAGFIIGTRFGPPGWRNFDMVGLVAEALNGIRIPRFLFEAGTGDYGWIGASYDGSEEKEWRAFRRRVTEQKGMSKLRETIGIPFYKRADYGAGEAGGHPSWEGLKRLARKDKREAVLEQVALDVSIQKGDLSRPEIKASMTLRARRDGLRALPAFLFSFANRYEAKVQKDISLFFDPRTRSFWKLVITDLKDFARLPYSDPFFAKVRGFFDEDGKPLPFLYKEGQILLDMGQPLRKGESRKLTLVYEAPMAEELRYDIPDLIGHESKNRGSGGPVLDDIFISNVKNSERSFALRAGLPWVPRFRGRSWTRFSLTVHAPKPFLAAASAKTLERGLEGNETTLFRAESEGPQENFALFWGDWELSSEALYDDSPCTEWKTKASPSTTREAVLVPFLGTEEDVSFISLPLTFHPKNKVPL